MDDYGYFDEAYFENGATRGTVYNEYRETAKRSPLFREIARAMIEVFRPKKVLEIGCATGIMVKHLNDAGCEAHGIDVSEWAIRNREHPNVVLASAGDLPYADDAFDLVFSCHSIEHLPDSVVDAGLSEMSRVCRGIQFHMLPMVGTPPFTGPIDAVIAGLKKDPTHNQLHSASWWQQRIEAVGNRRLEVAVTFSEDNAVSELAHGQLTFHKNGTALDESRLARDANAWNLRVVEALRAKSREPLRVGHVAETSPVRSRSVAQPSSLVRPKKISLRTIRSRAAGDPRGAVADVLDRASRALREPAPLVVPVATGAFAGALRFESAGWKDLGVDLPVGEDFDLTRESLFLVAHVDGEACRMRIALGQDRGEPPFERCMEYAFHLQPGLNWIIGRAEDFRVLRGEVDPTRINRIAFGGDAEGRTIRASIYDSRGNSLVG